MANTLKIFKTVLILTRKIPDFTNSTPSASPPPTPHPTSEPLFIYKLPIRRYNIRQNKPTNLRQLFFVFFPTIRPLSCDGGVRASSCSPVCLDDYFNALKSSELALTTSAEASIFVAENARTNRHPRFPPPPELPSPCFPCAETWVLLLLKALLTPAYHPSESPGCCGRNAETMLTPTLAKTKNTLCETNGVMPFDNHPPDGRREEDLDIQEQIGQWDWSSGPPVWTT